jgi:hypothetical protein
MPSASGSFLQQLDLGLITAIAEIFLALVGTILLAVVIACFASVAGMCMSTRGSTKPVRS